MKYWVDGIDHVLKQTSNVDQNKNEQGWNLLTKRLETEIRRLRRALELSCEELKVTPESMLLKVDCEVEDEGGSGTPNDTAVRPFKAEVCVCDDDDFLIRFLYGPHLT